MKDKDKTREQLAAELVAAREDEARFRRLLDNMPDVAFRWSVKKGLEYVSPSVFAVTGYAPEELMGEDPMKGLKLAKSKQKDINNKWTKSVTEKGAAPFEEFIFTHKDGTEGYLEVRSVPVMDNKGNLVAAEGILRDITERKRLEQKLRESEQKFRLVFDNAPDEIFRISPEGVFCMVNPRVYDIFGYRQEEVVGKTMADLDLMPPEELERVATLIFGKPDAPIPRFHLRAKHKDGHEFDCEADVVAMTGPNGEFDGYVGLIRDITERRQMEQALQESERKFKETFQHVGDVIYRIDASGRFEMMNDRAFGVFGYRPDELIGRSLFEIDVFPADEIARMSELFTDAVAKGTTTVPVIQLRAKHKDGHEILVEVNVTNMMGPDGQFQGFMGVIRDVTERKRMEDELRESEARFRRLLNNMPDVIFRWNMEKGLEYVSPSILTVTGFAPEELMGADPMKGLKIAKSKRKTITEDWRRSVTEEGAAPMDEFVFERKDGSTGYLEVKAVPIMDDKGNMVAAEGILRDISQRKKMEEALRESEARFRRLLDNIPDVVFRWDMQKGLEYVSPSVLNVTGYKPEELMGGDPMKGLKLAQTKRETIHEDWTKSVTEEGAAPMDEFVFERKDGSTGYLEVRSVPIMDDKGNPVAAEGILIDITKRKKMEDELLRHRDQLEQMVQERTAELTKAQEIATRQAQEIIEMSTPIILLRRGILLAPLIGTLNSDRAQQFTERLLNAIAQTNSAVALVDITGVPTVDTQTAHYLTRTISAVRLLGAQAILTGVGPSLASTLVELGIDLSNVITRSALSDGLEDGMRLLSGAQR